MIPDPPTPDASHRQQAGSPHSAADNEPAQTAAGPSRRRLIWQMIVLPAVIVGFAVGGYITLQWRSQPPGDPETLLRIIESGRGPRWQAAAQLAAHLHSPQGEAAASDPQFRQRVTAAANRELNALEREFDDQRLRTAAHLLVAQSAIATPETCDVLLRAAAFGRDRREQSRLALVRAVALARLAALAEQHEPLSPARREQLVARALQASEDHEPVVRSAAAFLLGVLGGEQASRRLGEMLDDAEEDVRANAALGLARRGDARAAATLEQMLRVKPANLQAAPAAAAEQHKRITSALRGTQRLLETDAAKRSPAGAELTEDARRRLLAAVDQCARHAWPAEIQHEAQRLLERFGAEDR